MGGLCSSPKDPEAVTIEEVLHNTCSNKTCDGWVERSTSVETDWQYVGKGKGSFEQVRSFDYVGDGLGSYSKDSRTQYHGWRLGTYGSCCAAIASLTFFAVLLTKLVLPAASREAEQAGPAASHREADGRRHSRDRAAEAGVEPYNCSSYYFNQPWTESKALWCCAKHTIGCTTSAPPGQPGTSWMLVPVPVAPAGAEQGRRPIFRPWAGKRQASGFGAGMPGVTFNCSSDFGHWRYGWSSRKKEWCCERENKGCRYDCKDGADRPERWPADKRAWCCQREARSCGDPRSRRP